MSVLVDGSILLKIWSYNQNKKVFGLVKSVNNLNNSGGVMLFVIGSCYRCVV